MARFDVYVVAAGTLLVDVQTDYLDLLRTRLVIPLLAISDAPIPARKLNPVLLIEGEPYVLQTHLLSAVSARILGTPIDNLDRYYDEITDAIGLIFNGF
jgi:toxin CcdB